MRMLKECSSGLSVGGIFQRKGIKCTQQPKEILKDHPQKKIFFKTTYIFCYENHFKNSVKKLFRVDRKVILKLCNLLEICWKTTSKIDHLHPPHMYILPACERGESTPSVYPTGWLGWNSRSHANRVLPGQVPAGPRKLRFPLWVCLCHWRATGTPTSIRWSAQLAKPMKKPTLLRHQVKANTWATERLFCGRK